jgi:restriction system protein
MREQEKVRQQQHLAAQARHADQRTVEIERQVQILDDVLISALRSSPVTFDTLKAKTTVPPFDAGPLGTAILPPNWEDYVPKEPGSLARLFGGRERHAVRMAAARAQFDVAVVEHSQREAQREADLAVVKARHSQQVAEAAARDAAYNAQVDSTRLACSEGVPEAIEWFVRQVLDHSTYPPGIVRNYQIAYRPENRDVVVEMDLPAQEIIPTVRAYRYVKARDAIDPIPRSDTEIKQRYSLLTWKRG